MLLPPAPSTAYHPATYRARPGAYSGFYDEVRWGYYKGWAHGQIRRALHRKRWFQLGLQLDHTTLLVRIDDDGTVGTGRVLRFDHDRHKVSAMAIDGAPLRTLVVGPHAGRGTEAFVRTGDCRLLFRRGRDGDAWHLLLTWDLADLDVLIYAPGAAAAVTIGEARPPFAHRPGLVQRAMGLPVTGRARFRGLPIPVSQTRAWLAYGNVFLPPRVRAITLTAQGGGLGLALSDGDLLGEQQEAVLFLDGEAHGLPACAARIEGDVTRWRDPAGTVDLTFTPLASHRVEVTRRIPRSRQQRAWAAGRVTGRVPTPSGPREIDVLGLLEDHTLEG